jgi:Icc-related predicted phosphoesterase
MQRTPRRFLLCSDIHGDYAAVERMVASNPGIDGLIIAGDLTTNGKPDVARTVLRSFVSRVRVAIVAGNMDPRSLEPVFAEEAHLVDSRAVWWDDVAIFGVSGSPPTPMRTPYEIGEDEIMARAERGWANATQARWRIFVPHAPPANTSLDLIGSGGGKRHVGSTSVRAFIERRQPDLVVCGHIHEARGIETIGRSLVVNCGPAHLGYHAIASIGGSISVEAKP